MAPEVQGLLARWQRSAAVERGAWMERHCCGAQRPLRGPARGNLRVPPWVPSRGPPRGSCGGPLPPRPAQAKAQGAPWGPRWARRGATGFPDSCPKAPSGALEGPPLAPCPGQEFLRPPPRAPVEARRGPILGTCGHFRRMGPAGPQVPALEHFPGSFQGSSRAPLRGSAQVRPFGLAQGFPGAPPGAPLGACPGLAAGAVGNSQKHEVSTLQLLHPWPLRKPGLSRRPARAPSPLSS